MNKNPKIDEYIANTAAFVQPILTKLRALVHQVRSEIEESIKWGMPSDKIILIFIKNAVVLNKKKS